MPYSTQSDFELKKKFYLKRFFIKKKIDSSIYDINFIDSLSDACALLSRVFLKSVNNAERFFSHLKVNLPESAQSQPQESYSNAHNHYDNGMEEEEELEGQSGAMHSVCARNSNYSESERDYTDPNSDDANESKSSHEDKAGSAKAIYLTSHDGVQFLASYLIQKELVDTGVQNKRTNSTLATRRQYLCAKCPYKERNFSLFTAHLMGHATRIGAAKCRYCDFYEVSRTKLYNHEKLHPEFELSRDERDSNKKRRLSGVIIT